MRVSRSDGLRCDFSTNKLTMSTRKMSFCNFNSKSDGRRYDFFFSFKYSLPFPVQNLPDSPPRLLRVFLRPPSEVLEIPWELFGNTLRALFLKNRDFFCYGAIFLPNTRGPIGCLLRFWPSGPKPCGGNDMPPPNPNMCSFYEMKYPISVFLNLALTVIDCGDPFVRFRIASKFIVTSDIQLYFIKTRAIMLVTEFWGWWCGNCWLGNRISALWLDVRRQYICESLNLSWELGNSLVNLLSNEAEV